MPVVKFPGVTKTIYEMTPEEIEEQFNRVVATLPRMTEEEAVARQEQMDEEFYDEDARGTITNFSILLHDWTDATRDAYGEESKEYSDLQLQIQPVRQKLRKFRSNLYHPEVKKAIKPLSELWAEYRGWDQNDKGGLEQRKKPIGPEVLSAFWRTASFDL